MARLNWTAAAVLVLLAISATEVRAEEDKTADLKPDTVDKDLGASREGSRTDDEVI